VENAVCFTHGALRHCNSVQRPGKSEEIYTFYTTLQKISSQSASISNYYLNQPFWVFVLDIKKRYGNSVLKSAEMNHIVRFNLLFQSKRLVGVESEYGKGNKVIDILYIEPKSLPVYP
jgi:hypothetical protein